MCFFLDASIALVGGLMIGTAIVRVMAMLIAALCSDKCMLECCWVSVPFGQTRFLSPIKYDLML